MTPYIVAVLVLAIVGIIFLLRGRSSQPEAEEDTSQGVDESYTKRQLYEIARSICLKGRSKLDKDDLIDAINDELEDNQLASKIFNRF